MSLRLQAQAELERRRRSGRVDSKYQKWQRQYHDNWVALIHDSIDWRGDHPAPYQDETIAELQAGGRAAVRGPHGLGKTALAAWCVLAFALTREGDDWKVPTTASAWRQLTKYLWPEIHKWARRVRWDVVGRPPLDLRRELLTRSLKLGTGEAFALASDDHHTIEGAHAANLLYVFDEAKAIPIPTWDAAEGAMSSGDCYALAISTPGEPQGRFYDIHRRAPGYDDWWTRHVTLDEAIAAGRVSREWAEQRAVQWSVESTVYQNRVLGEFASSGTDGVIALSLVEAANRRWLEWDDAGRPLPDQMDAVGVDVARFGGDTTVLALRFGDVIAELHQHAQEDTMATTGRVAGVLQRYGGKAIVDVIGIGAGVVDRLREQGFDVDGFNAGERTDLKDSSGELGFVDKRAAAWWGLRERLETDAIALPPVDSLTGDLTAPRWRAMSGGKIRVESKDDIRKRLKRSTNDGDAVVQAFWPGDEWGGSVSMLEMPWGRK